MQRIARSFLSKRAGDSIPYTMAPKRPFPMVMLRSILVPGDRTRVYILAQMVAFLVHEYYRQ